MSFSVSRCADFCCLVLSRFGRFRLVAVSFVSSSVVLLCLNCDSTVLVYLMLCCVVLLRVYCGNLF